MTQEQAAAAIALLMRTPIRGDEAEPFLGVIAALKRIVSGEQAAVG